MNYDTNINPKRAGSELAYAALDDIPTPKADAKEIVGLVKSLPDGTESNNLGNLPSVSG